MYPANILIIDEHIKPLNKWKHLVRKSEISMVDPARHTGLPEGTLGELSETSLGKKYLIQTRTMEGDTNATKRALRQITVS